MTRTHFVKRSKNGKLGIMSAFYRTPDTCPDTCPLKDEGCYALFGPGGVGPFKIAAKHGSDDVASVIDQAIREVPQNGILRWEVSGDVVLPDGVTIDHEYIAQTNRFVAARPDVRVIRYSHAWRQMSPEMFAYPVNASCETLQDISEARAAGWQTVITATGPDDEVIGMTVDESRAIICPNQTHGVTCAECQLCSKERTSTVVFLPHGSGKRRASLAVSAARASSASV